MTLPLAAFLREVPLRTAAGATVKHPAAVADQHAELSDVLSRLAHAILGDETDRHLAIKITEKAAKT